MTTREVADLIGCSITHVRTLVQQGKLPAKRKPSTTNRHGYTLDIPRRSAERYRDTQPTRGWPRGKPRK